MGKGGGGAGGEREPLKNGKKKRTFLIRAGTLRTAMKKDLPPEHWGKGLLAGARTEISGEPSERRPKSSRQDIQGESISEQNWKGKKDRPA